MLLLTIIQKIISRKSQSFPIISRIRQFKYIISIVFFKIFDFPFCHSWPIFEGVCDDDLGGGGGEGGEGGGRGRGELGKEVGGVWGLGFGVWGSNRKEKRKKKKKKRKKINRSTFLRILSLKFLNRKIRPSINGSRTIFEMF